MIFLKRLDRDAQLFLLFQEDFPSPDNSRKPWKKKIEF